MEACRELVEEEDGAIRQALEKIVEDEAHHAAFAWKVVRWAIEREGEGEGKGEERVVRLLESIVTPLEIERIGGGRYRQEDVKLLCDLRTELVKRFRGEEEEREEREDAHLLYCGASAESNKVSHQVMQIVC